MAEYKELVNKRLLTALKKIQLVKKMTASPNYKPTQEEVEAIVNRLHAEADAIGHAFESRSKKTIEIEPVF